MGFDTLLDDDGMDEASIGGGGVSGGGYGLSSLGKGGGFVFLTRDKGTSHSLLQTVRDLSQQMRRRRGVLPEAVPTQTLDDEVGCWWLAMDQLFVDH